MSDATPRRDDRRRRPSRARIFGRQVRYQLVLLVRSPSAPFFTIVVPLMLLVALDLVYGSRTIPTRAGLRFPQFYLSSMIAFAIVNACYVNVLNGTTLARQAGMLKRIRGTPLPGGVYLAGRVVSAGLVGVLSSLCVVVASVWWFDATMVWTTMPGTVVLLLAGIVCLSCLGLAMTRLVPTEDAALPIAYGTFLPLAFISEVFFPNDTSPVWLRDLAGAFPLRPFTHALGENMAPGARGGGWHLAELGVLGGWTVAACVALVAFRWEPARGAAKHRRHLHLHRPHLTS